jgi:DNA-binding NtrC family response regulator
MNVDLCPSVIEEKALEPSVLIVDDDELTRGLCSDIARSCKMTVETAATTEAALDLLATGQFDLVITDIRIPEIGGMELIKRIHAARHEVGIMILTGYGTIDMAVEAVYSGVLDYVTKPFTVEVFEQKLKNLASGVASNRNRRVGHKKFELATDNFIGQSPEISQLRRQISQMRNHECSVLILGETGTGKEVVARTIHCLSLRAREPFVPVDCAALTPTLVESELFGHEKGAFTGADHTKIGLFEAAHKGTLFLDEIGELPKELQGKLLRVLEEREVRRVGSTTPRPVDVRIISASNRDLAAEVRAGNFRKDLFYRLNVVNIVLPPLRERMGDLPLLVHAFLERFGRRRPGVIRIAPEVWRKLSGHDWPGNVRELGNVIERGLALGSGPFLHEHDLIVDTAIDAQTQVEVKDLLCLETLERRAIFRALRLTKGSRSDAARLLGIGKTTLYRKLKNYNPDRSSLSHSFDPVA